MRPKKKVLLIDSEEDRLSILSFTLKVRGYAVRGVSDPAIAIDEVVNWDPELAIVVKPGSSFDLRKFFAEFAKVSPEMSTLLLSDNTLQSYASATLPSTVSPATLLERVRMLVARKRGPRKILVGTVRPEIALEKTA